MPPALLPVLADSRGLVSSRGSCCCAVCASSLRHENVPCPGGAQHRRSVLSRASKQNCTGQNQKKWCRNGAVLNPTAEMHFTEGSQGNEGTRFSVGNGPDPKSSVRKTPAPPFFVHFVCFCKSASVAPPSRPARSVVADVRGGFSGVSTPPPIHEPPIRKNDFQRLLKTRFMGPMLQLLRWWSSRHVGRTGVLKMAQD